MKQSKFMMALFLTPAILMFCLVFVYPSIRTVAMSFFNVKNVTDDASTWLYVGLGNFKTLAQSAMFRHALANMFRIWLFGGIFVVTVALLFSAMLTSGIRHKSLFRGLLYLPNVVSALAMATIWLQAVYSNEYGMLSGFFRAIGLDKIADIQWVSSQHIFTTMVFAYCVGLVGYFVLIFVAGIDRIPYDYYEAASIEGSGAFMNFFEITLPLLKDVIRTSIVLWSITVIGFFVWTQVFARFAITPETVTPMAYMYQAVFGRDLVTNIEQINVGLGAGVGVITTLIIIVMFATVNFIIRPNKDVEF